MKRGYLLCAVFLVILLSTSLVAAQQIGEGVTKAIDEFTNVIEPVASRILGKTLTGQYLFAKVLFLIIIFAIIWTALSRADFFSEHTWVLVVVSLAASILATRWLASEALMNTLILPYSALGIAISAGLPFVLFFLLVNMGFQDSPSIIKRIAWIFFAVIFIGLWISRIDSLTLGGSSAGYIYPVTAVAAIIMAVMDGTIHKFFVSIELDKLGKTSAQDAITELRSKIIALPNLVTQNIITQKEADSRRRIYRKKLRYLTK